MLRMTLAERCIADYLMAHRGRLVSGYELADEIGSKSEGSIRVLIHRMRHRHRIKITSQPGVYGGYKLTERSS